jgi:membrane protein involved in colicin uptake
VGEAFLIEAMGRAPSNPHSLQKRRQNRPSGREEFVRIGFFGYPERVKRRSPLETLKELWQRSRDGERQRLSTTMREAESALDAAERARQTLAAARQETLATRDAEARRLAEGAVTAAEGQRRMAWERTQRKRDAELARELERAIASHRQAMLEQERAANAFAKADAAVERVEERLARTESARQRAVDAAQQELVDEASMRRFMEQSRS